LRKRNLVVTKVTSQKSALEPKKGGVAELGIRCRRRGCVCFM